MFTEKLLALPWEWIIPLLLVLICLLFLIRKGALEAANLALTRAQIAPTGWPPALSGWSALHLSDLHFWEGCDLPQRVLEIVEEADPDAVLITGDMLLPGARGQQEAWDFLHSLAGRWPTYLVLGNEDRRKSGIQPYQEWNSTGVTLLQNEAVAVEYNGSRLWVAGVDDPHKGYDDLAAALKNISEGEPVILLAHSPVIIERPQIGRVAAVFSGHTHGGQICLPNGFAPYIHTPLPRRFARGLHRIAGKETILVVTRGAGTTRLHLRLWCPPEIALWQFTTREKDRTTEAPTGNI